MKTVAVVMTFETDAPPELVYESCRANKLCVLADLKGFSVVSSSVRLQEAA